MSTTDKLIRAYNNMLERLHHVVEKESKTVKHALEHAKEKAIELSELTHEEAEKIAAYLKRDLHDAAHYLSETEKELADWLQFDIHQIESNLLASFISVADKTRLELDQLNHIADGLYQTGEVTGPGALVCEQCRKILHFKATDHIPACPNCAHEVFRRPA